MQKLIGRFRDQRGVLHTISHVTKVQPSNEIGAGRATGDPTVIEYFETSDSREAEQINETTFEVAGIGTVTKV